MQACAHPLAVGEGLSRLLLFPLLVTVHLIVQELLRKQRRSASWLFRGRQSRKHWNGRDTERQTRRDQQHRCHVLTLSWAQGSLGWMTVVFLFHVPQYAGR